MRSQIANKNRKPGIVKETITVVSGGSASNYYATFAKNIAKTGYTPISAGFSFNHVQFSVWHHSIQGNTLTVGIRNHAMSGSLSSVTITAYVTYIRNDLL